MAYEEEQARRSKVVVETPNSRREVTQTEAVRQPDRGGVSGTTVGIIVVVAVALVTILVLVLLSGQTSSNENLAAQQQPAPVPQTTIVQQPAAQQEPPVIIQQPATQPAPVIVTPPAPTGGTTAGTTTNVPGDATVQAEIDKKIADDPAYSSLGITATVFDGKVTLVGSVKSDSTKQQIERMVRHIKGVKSIDNQISVVAG